MHLAAAKAPPIDPSLQTRTGWQVDNCKLYVLAEGTHGAGYRGTQGASWKVCLLATQHQFVSRRRTPPPVSNKSDRAPFTVPLNGDPVLYPTLHKQLRKHAGFRRAGTDRVCPNTLSTTALPRLREAKQGGTRIHIR